MTPLAEKTSPPWIVALNLTRRCNLKCQHCYLDAGMRNDGSEDELTTDEVRRVLDDISVLSDECMIVLTGGEPLLRKDLEEIARYGSSKGLMIVVGSNGVLLSEARALALKEAGVAGIGLSVDSLDPRFHDNFRGAPGAWARTMSGIDACRKTGLSFQIHFSVMEENADELGAMIDFATTSGALALNVFFMVCTGRGEKFSDISAQTYDRVLEELTAAARGSEGLMIRAKCAPHFKRLAHELDPDWPVTVRHGYDAGGCLAGTRYARVTPEGDVTACPYIEENAGSVRDDKFSLIWSEAPMFKSLRKPALEGRCGACEYRVLCGGCRARGLVAHGNLMAEDPLCSFRPEGGSVIGGEQASIAGIQWDVEAETRLARVPGFVRRMVRERAETFVVSEGRNRVTTHDLAVLMERRFGKSGPMASLRQSLQTREDTE